MSNELTNVELGRIFFDLSNCFTVCPGSSCTINQSPGFGIGIDGKLSSIEIVKIRRISSFN